MFSFTFAVFNEISSFLQPFLLTFYVDRWYSAVHTLFFQGHAAMFGLLAFAISIEVLGHLWMFSFALAALNKIFSFLWTFLWTFCFDRWYSAVHTLLFQGLFILAGHAAMFGLLAFVVLVEILSHLKMFSLAFAVLDKILSLLWMFLVATIKFSLRTDSTPRFTLKDDRGRCLPLRATFDTWYPQSQVFHYWGAGRGSLRSLPCHNQRSPNVLT